MRKPLLGKGAVCAMAKFAKDGAASTSDVWMPDCINERRCMMSPKSNWEYKNFD
jgi:hypothetical protein